MKEGGGRYSPEDKKRASLRLVLESVVDCEEAAAPRFVTLRYNELAEKRGLDPTTEGTIAAKLEVLRKAGYLTANRSLSLLTSERTAFYYKRTSKELPDDPDDPGTPPRPPSAPAAMKSAPPDDDDDAVKQFRRRS